MFLSNCCGAPFYEPGWPDNDLCTACKEHTDAYDDEYLITDCCGQPVLYQLCEDGTYDEWEFCAECLKPYDKVTEKEYEKEENNEQANV